MRSFVAYECDECGKTLASEGGFEIHMETHRRPSTPPKAGPTEVMPVHALPPLPASPPGPPKTQPQELVIVGLALAAALVFFVGLAAAINPSMIRRTHHTALASTNAPHEVAIPDSTPTTTLAEIDKRRVGSLVLQQADYGPGWQLDGAGFSGGDSADSSSSDGLDACSAAMSGSGGNTNADASGPDVIKGKLKASTSAALYPSADEAAADLATFNDPKALPCLQAAMKQGIVDGGLPASAVTVGGERFTVASGAAQNIGLRIIATVHGSGGSKTFYLDMILLRHERAAAFLLMFAEDARVPTSVEQALVGRLAERLAGAEGVPA